MYDGRGSEKNAQSLCPIVLLSSLLELIKSCTIAEEFPEHVHTCVDVIIVFVIYHDDDDDDCVDFD